MDVDGVDTATSSSSHNKKRRHPGSSAVAFHSSYELLKLVETPNFEELARRYPDEFGVTLRDVQQIQHNARGTKATFSSCVTQEFSVALTRGLLHMYLNVRLPQLPTHHLCPPVPNRLFYLHWIHTELLSQEQQVCRDDQQRQISRSNGKVGLDLGVGASCIYPLLAARVFNDRMIGSDVNVEALQLAQANVDANQLQHQIHLLHVLPSHAQEPSTPLGGPLQRTLDAIQTSKQQAFSLSSGLDFVMTNPPFYDPNSMEEDQETAQAPPRIGDGRARTNMTMLEGSYPQGEVGFVVDVLVDSLRARTSSRWFSSMLGKKTSLIFVTKLLTHLLGPAHIQSTEYGPGQYTRWFVAWTFDRPLGTAPTARLQHANDVFTVVLNSNRNNEDDEHNKTTWSPMTAITEVMRRVQTFCDSSPGGWHLTTKTTMNATTIINTSSTTMGQTNGGEETMTAEMEIQERAPLPVQWFVDESEPNATMPPSILHALQEQSNQNSQFLPSEGHFVLLVSIQCSSKNPHLVQVQLECYRHSTRGTKAIEKLRTGMEPEVCRTNRKWRRLLQRQQQQEQQKH